MALKAGYVGIKSQLMQSLRDKLLKLDGIIPAGASSENQLATAADVAGRVDWPSYAKTGAYNLLDTRLETLKKINTEGIWSGNDYTLHNVTFTVDDGKITMTGLSNDVTYFNLDTNFNATKYNGWIVNGSPVEGSVPTYVFRISNSTSDRVSLEDMFHAEGDSVYVTGTGKCLAIRVQNSYNPNGAVISPMLSVKGGAYVPYAMTNEELTENALMYKGNLDSTNDLNNITERGIYTFTTTPTNAPDSRTYGTIIVNRRSDTDISQFLYTNTRIYVRKKGDDWSNWFKFEGTEVTPSTLTRSEDEPAATTKTTRSKKTTKEE